MAACKQKIYLGEEPDPEIQYTTFLWYKEPLYKRLG